MTVELDIKYAGGRRQRIALRTGKYIVGREAGDIIVDDPSVSTRHAEIDVCAGRATLTDLGSTNGTYDGDVRLSGARAMVPNHALRLGTATLTLVPAEPARGARPSSQTPSVTSPRAPVGISGAPRALHSWKGLRIAVAGIAVLAFAGWARGRVLAGLLGQLGEPGRDQVELGGLRLGMTPDEAARACEGAKVRFDHLPLQEPVLSRRPLFDANGVYQGGPPQAATVRPPDPSETRASQFTENINPPPGRYLATMFCNHPQGGHRNTAFTRPPAVHVSEVRQMQSLAAEKRTFAAYKQELIERFGPISDEEPLDSRNGHVLVWLYIPQTDDCRASTSDNVVTADPAKAVRACQTTKLIAWIYMQDGAVKSSEFKLQLTSEIDERTKFERIAPKY